MDQEETRRPPEMTAIVEPYVFETLRSVEGEEAVIQTTQGSLQGRIVGVQPDHVVLERSGGNFFVRIQEIVWVTLDVT
ncbi:uncharacterized protein DUF2642 [Salsuginibacillus halophilus]|uniref:Uncharacterized protein DUF2642 n=1 Tax=Salsuginibacillus halophilus TaxID=517424 RepID=A0A2P8HWJ6_9BACI|nr:YuzF family protein [Salsuginibacillus halophilus]PSL50597.1 uncharacterized protein DUF2642 [Salsuginibacillus halophilus]